MEDYTKAGIYLILNIVNYKVYVGRTKVNFNKRWNRHKSQLNTKTHNNKYLQAAWNKYKENSFEFLVLEEIDRNDTKLLGEREYYWINKLESYKRNFGYNLSNEETGSIEYESSISYVITYPNGEEIIINNLQKFCTENNLGQGNMMGILLGNRYHHKRFKVRYLNKLNALKEPKWLVINPEGKEILIDELKQYCKSNNFNYSSFKQTSWNPNSIQYKGYRCYSLENVLNNTQEYPKCNFTFKVITPNNTTHFTDNLMRLGEEVGLNGKLLNHVYHNKNKKHKDLGWQVIKL